MFNEKRSPKRPPGWSKPYWAQAGLCVCVTLASFLASLLVVGFVCGLILRAAIPAEPIVWRAIETAMDVLICAGTAWYFASREGYTKRKTDPKATALGSLWFLLIQCPLAVLFRGAPYVTGPLASTMAQLIYFGNRSIYADGLETPPLWLILGCMAVADAVVLTPVMMIAERIGAKIHQKEIAELTEIHPQE